MYGLVASEFRAIRGNAELVMSVGPEAPELRAAMREGRPVTCRVCRHSASVRSKRSPFVYRRFPFMMALSSPLGYVLYVLERGPAPSAATPPRKVPVRVPLAGEELRAFRDEENRKRRLEAEEEEQRRHAAAMEKEQASRRSGMCFVSVACLYACRAYKGLYRVDQHR